MDTFKRHRREADCEKYEANEVYRKANTFKRQIKWLLEKHVSVYSRDPRDQKYYLSLDNVMELADELSKSFTIELKGGVCDEDLYILHQERKISRIKKSIWYHPRNHDDPPIGTKCDKCEKERADRISKYEEKIRFTKEKKRIREERKQMGLSTIVLQLDEAEKTLAALYRNLEEYKKSDKPLIDSVEHMTKNIKEWEKRAEKLKNLSDSV